MHAARVEVMAVSIYGVATHEISLLTREFKRVDDCDQSHDGAKAPAPQRKWPAHD